jgi:hypothetical protein
MGSRFSVTGSRRDPVVGGDVITEGGAESKKKDPGPGPDRPAVHTVRSKPPVCLPVDMTGEGRAVRIA